MSELRLTAAELSAALKSRVVSQEENDQWLFDTWRRAVLKDLNCIMSKVMRSYEVSHKLVLGEELVRLTTIFEIAPREVTFGTAMRPNAEDTNAAIEKFQGELISQGFAIERSGMNLFLNWRRQATR